MRVIYGLFRLDGGEAREKLVEAMAAQINPKRRALPNYWKNGPVAIGVLDFGERKIPLPLPRNNHSVIAADVRLDAPKALAKELGGPDEPEDALLLSALDSFSAQGLARVLGDFAFACWRPQTQKLICGRDVFGIRPFYYVYKPGSLFAFASLPHALHGAGVVPKVIDEDALLRRVSGKLSFDDSLIKDIKRLPPAHILEVSRAGISLTRYFQLDRAAVGSRRCRPEEAARELRRLVEQAVICRLPPGGVGAHLSGGLDSSAIAVLAARHLREGKRKLHVYSFLDRLRNDVTLEDETDFVQAILKQEDDVDWTPVRPSVRSDDAPSFDVDNMAVLTPGEPENQVCAQAEQQGVEIVLSGWGGDEAATFNGRGTLAEHFLRGRWALLGREAKALAKERRWPLLRVLYGEVLSYILPEGVINLARRVRGKRPALLTLSDNMLTGEARKRLAENQGERLEMSSDGSENRWRLITSPHIVERTERWAAIGARHGLAYAYPLLDRRVVEFALSLPSELFVREGFRRRPFRDAMKNVLPDRVRMRHQKYMPFPSILLDLSEEKGSFSARIDECELDGSLSHIINFSRLRSLLVKFPSPAQAREQLSDNQNPEGAAEMITVSKLLAMAEYVKQHGNHGEGE